MKPDFIVSKKDQDFEATNAPKGGAQDQLHRLSRSDKGCMQYAYGLADVLGNQYLFYWWHHHNPWR